MIDRSASEQARLQTAARLEEAAKTAPHPATAARMLREAAELRAEVERGRRRRGRR